MKKLTVLAALVAALVVGSTASATHFGSAVVVQQQLVTPFVPVVQAQVVVAQPVVVATPVVQQVVVQKQVVQKVVVQKQVHGYGGAFQRLRSIYGGCR